MKLAPGVRAVVAFPMQCCGHNAGSGQVGIVLSMPELREGYCPKCWRRGNLAVVAFELDGRLEQSVPVLRLLPLPPDDEAAKMFKRVERHLVVPR